MAWVAPCRCFRVTPGAARSVSLWRSQSVQDARRAKDEEYRAEQDRDQYEGAHDGGDGHDGPEDRMLRLRARRTRRVVAATPATTPAAAPATTPAVTPAAAQATTTGRRPATGAAGKGAASTFAGEPACRPPHEHASNATPLAVPR